MSTNFYLAHAADREPVHIGKRSGGWQFGFRGYPDIRSRADWEARIAAACPPAGIIDEYGTPWGVKEFWAAVDATRIPSGDGTPPRRRVRHLTGGPLGPLLHPDTWQDDQGWDFTSTEFC